MFVTDLAGNHVFSSELLILFSLSKQGLLTNDIARALKNYAHQRETTGSSSGSFQLLSFSKWELLLKERIRSQRKRILSFKSSFLWYGKALLPY